MAFYTYKAIQGTGERIEGVIEASSIDIAIASLQKKGLILSTIVPQDGKKSIFDVNISFFNKVTTKDVVILSRQLATLFDAQVSALRIFRLIGDQAENPLLKKRLIEVSDDLKDGSSISLALSKHKDVFSDFYVNMVRSGEESGKLNETFDYLADYLDRNYEVESKAKSALIYPSFVIATFLVVMVLMFTVIIPKIGVMIQSSGSGAPIPEYTQVVLEVSSLLIHYGLFVAIGIILIVFGVWKYLKTTEGARNLAIFKLKVPYVGDLFRKLYFARICDNMSTMVASGIPMLRALEITASVVDNDIYKAILTDALTQVKGGTSLSNALGQYPKDIPGIMVQMVKVGEETGELGSILKTLAKFYQREVINAVDTLVSLIEPVMIVTLGLGVGLLLASVLVPIYNIAATS